MNRLGRFCRADEGTPRNANGAYAAPPNPEEHYGDDNKIATKLGLEGSIPLGQGATLDVGLNLHEGVTSIAGGKSGYRVCLPMVHALRNKHHGISLLVGDVINDPDSVT